MTAKFVKVSAACEITGLSKWFLRKGCRENTIPHIRSGKIIYIDLERLLEQLRAGSDGN